MGHHRPLQRLSQSEVDSHSLGHSADTGLSLFSDSICLSGGTIAYLVPGAHSLYRDHDPVETLAENMESKAGVLKVLITSLLETLMKIF